MDIKISGTVQPDGCGPTDIDLTVYVPENLIGAWLAAVTRAGRGGTHGELDPQEIIDWLEGNF